MKIVYVSPDPSFISATVRLPDGTAANSVECEYSPEPVVGVRELHVGVFTAIGDSGRREVASVVFDLRKGEFVIRPRKLEATGFAFDKVATEVAVK